MPGGDLPQGLTNTEAAARLARDGGNELPTARPRGLWAMAFEVAREPMALLLIACGALYLVLGDLHEAAVLLVFVVVVMGITLYQEHRTGRVLEALRDLSSPRALVIRDGTPRRIAGREVVVGDLLVLAEGDRVPADGQLIEATNLGADESLLTGESVPVMKCDDGEGDVSRVFSGTLIVRGRGTAQVSATGAATMLGRIGGALVSTRAVATPLQRQTRTLVRRVAVAGLVFSLAVPLGYGLLRGEWLTGLLAGLALAMSVLPEEFPMILAVFLALGGWRLSRHNVLTRRLPAVETLGAATILCVDKTGTLTENRMSVQALWNGYERLAADAPPPEAFHALVEFAGLASARDPFDPMEQAILRYVEMHLARTDHEHPDWQLLREYPLAAGLLSMSQVWRSPRRRQLAIAAKGAPEAIIDLCHLNAAETARWLAAAHEFARRGLRVLGVACATWPEADGATLPDGQHEFDFAPLGLVGLADPLRADVPAAIAECRAAGLRVLMITGDYPETAASIAAQAGFGNGVLITGGELDGLNDAELASRLRAATVIARAVPEHKLRIVRALQAAGEIVAMTGDGVNDAPALKAADIGVAMGARGTDVAREAAALVLLDDAFASIVRAVRLGRRIHDNIRKAVRYVLVVHLPIVTMALLPLLLGWPLILLPEHIALFELLIAPACALAFEAEPEEHDVMARPPRAYDAPLISRRAVLAALVAGALGGAAALAATGWSIAEGAPLAMSRTVAFIVVVLANVATIAAWRSRPGARHAAANRTARGIIVGAIAVLALVVGVAPVGAQLGFMRPVAPLLLACIAAALAYFGALLVLRRFGG
jgi:P-type Ca2+ transporter type 2C